jgi:hypothetical protein
VAAPLVLLGLVAAAVAVATGLWGAWHPDDRGAAFIATLLGSALVSSAAFVAARGCFVEAGADELRDVVGWVTVRRYPRATVVGARVRSGAWRWFEIELDDATLVTLLGASPAQGPSRSLPEAMQQDITHLRMLRGA